MLKKYYANTSTFQCVKCKHIWKLNIWQWLWTMNFNFVRHRYVKCPRCGVKHWLQAMEVVK